MFYVFCTHKSNPQVPFSLLCQLNKKYASKNVDFWQSYSYVKVLILYGPKNALSEQFWFVTSSTTPFYNLIFSSVVKELALWTEGNGFRKIHIHQFRSRKYSKF